MPRTVAMAPELNMIGMASGMKATSLPASAGWPMPRVTDALEGAGENRSKPNAHEDGAARDADHAQRDPENPPSAHSSFGHSTTFASVYEVTNPSRSIAPASTADPGGGGHGAGGGARDG